MEPVDRHQLDADARFDGGDLDCGNGLLLLIRQHMDPMERGQLLADNPFASAQVAEAKLRAIVAAAELVRRG